MINTIKLQIYDLSINHPKDWKIHIHPTIPFLYDGGSFKIENISEEKKSDISMLLRWTKTDKDIDILNYTKELKSQYDLRHKKNKREVYNIIKTEEIKLSHKSYFIHSEIISNHGIFGFFSNNEELSSLQICTYCDKTKRIIVVSLTTDKINMDKNYDEYKNILLSLKCHSI